MSLEIVERRCQAPQRTLPGYPIPDSSIHIPLWLIYALVALVFWGVTGVTQKLSTNAVSSQLSFLWFAVSIIVISEGVAVAVPIRRHMAPRIFWMAVIDGALNGLGALTSFAAFEKGGKASIVVPLCYLFPLVTVVLALTFCTSRSPGRRRSASSLHCSSGFTAPNQGAVCRGTGQANQQTLRRSSRSRSFSGTIESRSTMQGST